MTPDMFPPPGMMGPGMPPMPPGPIMLPPGVSPDMPFPMGMPVPNPTPEEMAHFGGGFPPMGPSMGPTPPQMFGPPPPSMPQGPQGGNNWQGPGGNWYDNEQSPPNHQGPGRFQGGSSWRGSRGGSNRNRKYCKLIFMFYHTVVVDSKVMGFSQCTFNKVLIIIGVEINFW